MAEWKRIVVGVDGSEYSQRALRWASEEASQHNADLLAVSVWTPPPATIDPPFGGFPWGADANREEHAKAMLERAVLEVFQRTRQVTCRLRSPRATRPRCSSISPARRTSWWLDREDMEASPGCCLDL